MEFFDRNKSILITGGCGFIGSHLVRFLLDRGKKVIVLDDLSTGYLENIPVDHENLEFIEGSILDLELLESIKGKVSLIFHLASYVGMKLVYEKPDVSYQLSKQGTTNMLSISQDIPIVLFSSSAVYGNTKDVSKETESISIDNAMHYDGDKLGYAAGKYALEQLGSASMDENRDIMIVRPFNVIGIRQSSKYGMVVPTFIESALKHEPLVIYDDGKQTRSFGCVEKFTTCLYQLINTDEAWVKPNNIVNIGCPNSIEINELADTIIRITKSKSVKVYKP